MDNSYEAPTVTSLGKVTDLTRAKGGIYFDFPGAQEGNTDQPAPGTPGTVHHS